MISSIIVILQVMVCTSALCDIPHIVDRYNTAGTIGFPEQERSLTRRQKCSWELESANHTRHILYLQIAKFDFESGKRCSAHVTFDNKEKLCHQRKQCILFLRNRSKIEFDVVEEKLDFGKQPCKYMSVDRGDISKVQIDTDDVNISDFRFKLTYRYIELPQANRSKYKYSEKNQRREESDTSCGNGLVATLVVESVLLAFALILLFVCIKINRFHSLQRQPRTRGSFYQTDSVDHEVDLQPVRSPPTEPKPSRTALTRFSKLTRKSKAGNGHTNFIHFTLSRNEPEKPQRSKSLPDVKARLQVNVPDRSGGDSWSVAPNPAKE